MVYIFCVDMFPPTDSAKSAFDLFPTTDNVKDINPPRSLQLEEMNLTVWFNRLEKDSVNADSIIGARRRQEDVQLCEGFELRFYYVTSDYVDFAITTVDETGQKMINTCKYNLDDKSTNHWIFAAITYKKETGEQKLYIKGEEVCSALLKPNNKLVPLEYENYEDIRIGHSRVNQGYFNGYIDDVAIYNRPLTAEEIKLIYTLEKNRTR